MVGHLTDKRNWQHDALTPALAGRSASLVTGDCPIVQSEGQLIGTAQPGLNFRKPLPTALCCKWQPILKSQSKELRRTKAQASGSEPELLRSTVHSLLVVVIAGKWQKSMILSRSAYTCHLRFGLSNPAVKEEVELLTRLGRS